MASQTEEVDTTCPQCSKPVTVVIQWPDPDEALFRVTKSNSVWVTCPLCKASFPIKLPPRGGS